MSRVASTQGTPMTVGVPAVAAEVSDSSPTDQPHSRRGRKQRGGGEVPRSPASLVASESDPASRDVDSEKQSDPADSQN